MRVCSSVEPCRAPLRASACARARSSRAVESAVVGGLGALVGFGETRFGFGARVGGFVARGFGCADGIEQRVALDARWLPAPRRAARVRRAFRRGGDRVRRSAAPAAARRASQRGFLFARWRRGVLRGASPSRGDCRAPRALPPRARALRSFPSARAAVVSDRLRPSPNSRKRVVGMRHGFERRIARLAEPADFRFERRKPATCARRRRAPSWRCVPGRRSTPVRRGAYPVRGRAGFGARCPPRSSLPHSARRCPARVSFATSISFSSAARRLRCARRIAAGEGASAEACSRPSATSRRAA